MLLKLLLNRLDMIESDIKTDFFIKLDYIRYKF